VAVRDPEGKRRGEGEKDAGSLKGWEHAGGGDRNGCEREAGGDGVTRERRGESVYCIERVLQ